MVRRRSPPHVVGTEVFAELDEAATKNRRNERTENEAARLDTCDDSRCLFLVLRGLEQ